MLTQEVTIKIPLEVKGALRIPERELVARLSLELAVHLFEEWLLPFGKAADLAQVSRWRFAEELAKRKIVRHYTEKEAEEDIAFAAGDNHGR